MKHVITIFSGGPDSTATALWARENGFEVTLLTFQLKNNHQYGEIFHSMQVANRLKMNHVILDLKSLMSSFPPDIHILMHAGTPTKTATNAVGKSHRLPFGAGMILSVSSSYALYNGVENLAWGATKDDQFGGNLDYSQKFADNFSTLVQQSNQCPFDIRVPFSNEHKYQVIKRFNGDADLFSMTWSCKNPGMLQCGQCKACIARRISTEIVGLEDKTSYENSTYSKPFSDAQIQNIASVEEAIIAKVGGSEAG